MREIKFKAKGIEEYDKDKWYYGYYVKLDKTTYCFKEDYERNPSNSEHKILFDVMTDWCLPNQHKMADININTLCQYTGLKDKNGVEIYENDIVKARYEEKNGYIKWNSTNASFQVKGIPSHTLKRADELEVIENIYDKEVENEIRI